MQRKTAEKLRSDWGDVTCYHPMTDHEYIANIPTGNAVCLICGKAFNIRKTFLVLILILLVAKPSSWELIEIISSILDSL